jgi:hypothetical protein
MRAMIAKAGLVLAEIEFGQWANPIGHMDGFQDGLIALRPQ